MIVTSLSQISCASVLPPTPIGDGADGFLNAFQTGTPFGDDLTVGGAAAKDNQTTADGFILPPFVSFPMVLVPAAHPPILRRSDGQPDAISPETATQRAMERNADQPALPLTVAEASPIDRVQALPTAAADRPLYNFGGTADMPLPTAPQVSDAPIGTVRRDQGSTNRSVTDPVTESPASGGATQPPPSLGLTPDLRTDLPTDSVELRNNSSPSVDAPVLQHPRQGENANRPNPAGSAPVVIPAHDPAQPIQQNRANPPSPPTTHAQRLWGMMGHQNAVDESFMSAATAEIPVTLNSPQPDEVPTKDQAVSSQPQGDSTPNETVVATTPLPPKKNTPRAIIGTTQSGAPIVQASDHKNQTTVTTPPMAIVHDAAESPATKPLANTKAEPQQPTDPFTNAFAQLSLNPTPQTTGIDPFSLPLSQIAVTSTAHSGSHSAPLHHNPLSQPLLASVMAEAAKPSVDGVSLTLAPEELGRLQMTIQTNGDQLTMAILADRPETLDLMRRHADQLAQELRQAGFAQTAFTFSQGNAQGFSRPNPQPNVAQQLDAADSTLPPQLHRSPHPSQISHGNQAGLDLRL